MATRVQKFQRIRKPSGETVETLGARLDRVQDNIGQVLDATSEAMGGLGTGAAADLSDATPLALASAGQAGTAEEASRSDHRHPFPGAYQLRTRQAVTTATTLSGTGDLTVAITALFNGAITLPAATTAGQTITVTDEAGVGSGDSNGASESLIYLLCAGSDTITAPGLATSRTRLLLWKKYGTITLVADGTSSWKATERYFWHVDPRAISGLECWYDSRRGITLNSTTVSAWADISGAANADLAQAVAANQPRYAYASNVPNFMQNYENIIQFTDTSDSLASSATVAITSGSVTIVGGYTYDFSRSAGTERLFQSAVTGALGIYWSLNDSAPPGGAAAGSTAVVANNTAGTSYRCVPSTFATLKAGLSSGGMRRVDIHTLGTSFELRPNNQFANSAAAVSGAVTNFTQTVQVGNSVVAILMQVMMFDAVVSIPDKTDIYNAIVETYGATV